MKAHPTSIAATARRAEMHGKICNGCGTAHHLDDIREAGQLSCCPERKMIDASDLWLENNRLREALAALKNARRMTKADVEYLAYHVLHTVDGRATDLWPVRNHELVGKRVRLGAPLVE